MGIGSTIARKNWNLTEKITDITVNCAIRSYRIETGKSVIDHSPLDYKLVK